MHERFEFHSPLPPSQCAQLISAEIDSDSFFSLPRSFKSHGFTGHVTESSLRLRRRIEYRNSFHRRFVGRFAPEGSGTVIAGRFVMHPFVVLFMIVWLTGVLGGGSALIFMALRYTLSHSAPGLGYAWLLIIVMPPMLCACGFAAMRLRVPEEEQAVRDFLTRTLSPPRPERVAVHRAAKHIGP